MLIADVIHVVLAILSSSGAIIIYSVFVRLNVAMLIAYFQRARPYHTLVRNFSQDKTISMAIAWMGPIVTLPIMFAAGFPTYGLKLSSSESQSSRWFKLAVEDAARRGLLRDQNHDVSSSLGIAEISGISTEPNPSNKVPGKCVSIWKTPDRWKKRPKKSPETLSQSFRHVTLSSSGGQYLVSNNS